MAVTVDTSGLDRLMESWDALVKQFPEKKRGLLEQIGARLLQEVRSGWQAPHMGSGGGYVAVRPKAETYQTTKSGKRYAVGYITNAIEGGHRHGGPRGGGKGYRYRPRYQTAAVPCRFFYEAARAALAGMGREEADRLMQLIVDGLEGNL